jgi:hypothetical protein
VQIVFSLRNVQLSLFSDPAYQVSTLGSLTTAVASASGVVQNLVSIRRVRDISNPSFPTIVWINPQYAGDVFPARRRLSALGAVSIDTQITLFSNVVAASMSASLSSSSAKLASDVKMSLVNQSSPLSSSQIEAVVQPYLQSLKPSESRDLFSSLMSTTNINVAISITLSLFSLSIIMGFYVTCRKCLIKRRLKKSIHPAPSDNNDNEISDDEDKDEVEKIIETNESSTESVESLDSVDQSDQIEVSNSTDESNQIENVISLESTLESTDESTLEGNDQHTLERTDQRTLESTHNYIHN